MSTRTLNVTADLHNYVLTHSAQPDDVQRALIDETHNALADRAGMQISPDEGNFLTLMTKLVNAKSAVEIGTFTGYSSLCIARGLATGGKLLCCDVSEEWTAIAQRYWAMAGVQEKIDLVLAPAIETVRALSQEPTVDVVFIDADKESYVDYWEEMVPRVRPGGVLLVDNTLWSGRVTQPVEEGDSMTRGITQFNDHAAADERVDLVVLTLSDGVTMAVKR